jgi:hypothetical protein
MITRSNAGEVYLIYGKSGANRYQDTISLGDVGTTTVPGVRFQGAVADDQAGTDVAPAGDVNGDGRADFIISTFRPGEPTDYYLIYGKDFPNGTIDLSTVGSQQVPGAVFDGFATRASEFTGPAVVPVGDVTGDGLDDLVVISISQDAGTNGEAYLVFNLDGDLNVDGFVGQDDQNIVLANWNQTVTPPGDWLKGDPSGDGYVGDDDLNRVLGNWGEGIPPP